MTKSRSKDVSIRLLSSHLMADIFYVRPPDRRAHTLDYNNLSLTGSSVTYIWRKTRRVPQPLSHCCKPVVNVADFDILIHGAEAVVIFLMGFISESSREQESQNLES